MYNATCHTTTVCQRYSAMVQAHSQCQACRLHLYEAHRKAKPRDLFWSCFSIRRTTPYDIQLLFARNALQWFKHNISPSHRQASPTGFLEGKSQVSATEARSISADHEDIIIKTLKLEILRNSRIFPLIIAAAGSTDTRKVLKGPAGNAQIVGAL